MAEYPITSVQKAFLNYPEAFTVSKSLVFTGDLDLNALRASLSKIVERHEIMRSIFPKRGPDRVQVVLDPYSVELGFADFSSMGEAEQKSAIAKHVTENADRAFDVEQLPMWRPTVYKIGAAEYIFNLCLSHVIFDGWSMSIFTRELLDLYCSQVTGQPSLLQPIRYQYRDYLPKYQEDYSPKLLEKRAAYWRERLGPANDPALTKFVHTFKPVPWKLQSDILQELRALAARENASLYAVMAGFFAILVGHISSKKDIVLSIVASAERNRPELDLMLGAFNSVLPLPIKMSDDPNLHTVVERVRTGILDAGDNYFPLGSMEGKGLPRSTICWNLLSSAPPPMSFKLPGVASELIIPRALYAATDLSPVKLVVNRYYQSDVRHHSRMSPLKFNIRMIEKANELTGITWFNAEHFDEAPVKSLMENYVRLLENGIFTTSGKVSELAGCIDVDLAPFAGKF